MKRFLVMLLSAATLLTACGKKEELPATSAPPAPVKVNPLDLFPKPSTADQARLREATDALRGPLQSVDLNWVIEMGPTGVPALVQWSGDTNLTATARQGVLVLLGNTLKKLDLREHPDARNDLIVPVVLENVASPDPELQRAGAYVARYLNDARLVGPLRQLFSAREAVQEQAVLAMGSNGGEMDVLPVLKLFFETENGVFRYSCLYALSTMCLVHDLEIAPIIRQNVASFGEQNTANAESLARRFDEWRAQRQQGKNTDYLLRDFWLQPPPKAPVSETTPAADAGKTE